MTSISTTGRLYAATLALITFEQLVEHGKASATSLVGGVPWAFSISGCPVTHETDDCYLISTPAATLRFTRGDKLVTGSNGEILGLLPKEQEANAQGGAAPCGGLCPENAQCRAINCQSPLALSSIKPPPVDNAHVAAGCELFSAPVAPLVITPEPGRIVHYSPGAGDADMVVHGPQPLAAQVAYVWSDHCINLSVTDHAGNKHARTSVRLLQPGEDVVVRGVAYATWMPYQVQQATKAAQG